MISNARDPQKTNLAGCVQKFARNVDRLSASLGETIEEKTRDEIQSTGYVLHTLETALWCNLITKSYAECVQLAVNLGGDTDTTASVAGALAGARYGFHTIPESWREALRAKDLIDDCLFDVSLEEDVAPWITRIRNSFSKRKPS